MHPRGKGLAFAAFTSGLLAAAAGLAAPPVHDQMVITGGSRLTVRDLSTLVESPWVPFHHEAYSVLVMPSGKILTLTLTSLPPVARTRVVLNEVLEGGQLREIGILDPPTETQYTYESPLDLAIDPRGRLYYLGYVYAEGDRRFRRLVELDPETAAARSQLFFDHNINALAPAPGGGFWAMADNELRRFDPDSGVLGKKVTSLHQFGNVHDLDVDSSGRLHFQSSFVCSPPCPEIGSVDPLTGIAEYTRPQPTQVFPQFLSIRRRCNEGDTTRCLQGGRFAVEVTVKDPAGVTFPARVAAGRSGDTGIFFFFDPANWELMVKVLDGCGQNGSFWVFTSASTDVQYTLEVTDTETGAVKSYFNPPGQAALTVADIDAFACVP